MEASGGGLQVRSGGTVCVLVLLIAGHALVGCGRSTTQEEDHDGRGPSGLPGSEFQHSEIGLARLPVGHPDIGLLRELLARDGIEVGLSVSMGSADVLVRAKEFATAEELVLATQSLSAWVEPRDCVARIPSDRSVAEPMLNLLRSEGLRWTVIPGRAFSVLAVAAADRERFDELLRTSEQFRGLRYEEVLLASVAVQDPRVDRLLWVLGQENEMYSLRFVDDDVRVFVWVSRLPALRVLVRRDAELADVLAEEQD